MDINTPCGSFDGDTYLCTRAAARNVPSPPIAPEGGQPVAPGGNVPTPPIAPEGGRPVAPDGGNVPTPPIAPEGGRPVAPGGSNVPSLPIAPEGGRPVAPGGGNVPSLPIAPEGGRPVAPGGSNVPSLPIAPEGGRPVAPGPGAQGFARVRFLNAVAGGGAVRINVGIRTFISSLNYGNLSAYQMVQDGFWPVTVMNAAPPRAILLRKNIPFRAGSVVTLALVNTPNGIEITQIADEPCFNRPRNLACLRMVNLSYNAPPLDLMLSDGRVVFSDTRFKEVTSFKTARPGEYGFYVVATPSAAVPLAADIETLEQTPIPVSEIYVPGYGDLDPLLSFQLSMSQGVLYTVYILGLVGASPVLQTLIAENY